MTATQTATRAPTWTATATAHVTLEMPPELPTATPTLPSCSKPWPFTYNERQNIEAAAGVNTWAAADLASLLDYIKSVHLPLLTISQFYGLASAPLVIPGY